MATAVILCGLTKTMGGRVAPRLRPEYDVIQFITSAERAKTEINQMMSGVEPKPDPDDVGSHNFGQKPQAVLFGRGFEENVVQDIRKACGGSDSKLAWIVSTDEGRQKASLGMANDPKALDGYADGIAKVIKELLSKLQAEDKVGVDGLYFYGA